MESTDKSEARDEDTLASDEVLETCMEDLIDDIVCGLCFEVHRACKTGTFLLDECDLSDHSRFDIIDEIGLDVFGQPPIKKQFECICPSCNRTLAASRFAPHLEKCMGMGRISSRIASRRIATSSGCRRGSDAESDEDDDNDASYVPDRPRAKKVKRDRVNGNNSKKSRARQRNTDSPSTGSDISNSQASSVCDTNNTLVADDRKNLGIYTCAVLPEAKRQYTRSSRQQLQHSESQRRNMRLLLLDTHGGTSALSGEHLDSAGIARMTSDDINIDVDDGDSRTGGNGSAMELLSAAHWLPDDDHNSNASISAESSTSSIATVGGTRRQKFGI